MEETGGGGCHVSFFPYKKGVKDKVLAILKRRGNTKFLPPYL